MQWEEEEGGVWTFKLAGVCGRRTDCFVCIIHSKVFTGIAFSSEWVCCVVGLRRTFLQYVNSQCPPGQRNTQLHVNVVKHVKTINKVKFGVSQCMFAPSTNNSRGRPVDALFK